MIKRAKSMTNIITALEARTQLGEVMRQASENQKRFIVDKRGEPLVVIMGIQDYVNTIAPEAAVLTLLGRGAKRKGTSKLSMRQIDSEIRAARREKRTRDAKP
ncbi:MAG TPA: type II toxin-antitoxin system Phd/YefM family antitoxin [Gemmatimonadaceae bacterium]